MSSRQPIQMHPIKAQDNIHWGSFKTNFSEKGFSVGDSKVCSVRSGPYQVVTVCLIQLAMAKTRSCISFCAAFSISLILVVAFLIVVLRRGK